MGKVIVRSFSPRLFLFGPVKADSSVGGNSLLYSVLSVGSCVECVGSDREELMPGH